MKSTLNLSGLRTTLQKPVSLTGVEIKNMAERVFGPATRLPAIPSGIRPLFLISLKQLDTGFLRAGSVAELISFCGKRQESILELKTNDLVAANFLKALAIAFPYQSEQVRSALEQKLAILLGRNFKIEITDKVRSPVNQSIFTLWYEFLQLANLSKNRLKRIALSWWGRGHLFTRLDGKMLEVMDTAGGIMRNTILINTDGFELKPLFVAYHEFAEMILMKFGHCYVFVDPVQKEYVVDYIAWQILAKLGSEETAQYEQEMLRRHALDGNKIKKTQEVGNKILLDMRISHYRTKIGELAELEIGDDLIPIAALRDMPPKQRGLTYFKEGDYLVLDISEGPCGGEIAKAIVKSVDREAGKINIQIISDDGVYDDLHTGEEITSASVFKWDKSMSAFIPEGKVLREAQWLSVLGLERSIIHQLNYKARIYYVEELAGIPDDLLLAIGITADGVGQIASALEKFDQTSTRET